MNLFESLRNIRQATAPRIWLPGRTTPVKRTLHVMHAQVAHLRGDKVLWQSDGWQHNILHAEGEQFLLARSFYPGSATFPAPTQSGSNYFCVGLDARTTPLTTGTNNADTLASLTNEGGLGGGRTTGGGYSRKTVNVDNTTAPYFNIATDAGEYQAKNNSSLSWTASDDWTGLKVIFLATNTTATSSAATQRLLASVPFQGNITRTLITTDVLNASIAVKMSE